MPTMTPEEIAILISAAGLPLIIREAIAGWRASRNGKAQEEKERNRALIEQASRDDDRLSAIEDRAARESARADLEARRRRVWEAYAGDLRWQLLDCDQCHDKVKPWPDQ